MEGLSATEPITRTETIFHVNVMSLCCEGHSIAAAVPIRTARVDQREARLHEPQIEGKRALLIAQQHAGS